MFFIIFKKKLNKSFVMHRNLTTEKFTAAKNVDKSIIICAKCIFCSNASHNKHMCVDTLKILFVN